MQTRISEVIGGSDPIFTKVLSFFPEQAELYLTALNQLIPFSGQPQRENVSQDRQFELQCSLARGNQIRHTIDEIQNLRGNPESARSKLGYFKEYSVEMILEIISKKTKGKPLSEFDRMIDKTLEVMGVTAEEIGLMRNFFAANSQYDKLIQRATALEHQAQGFRTKAENEFKTAKTKIEKYRLRRKT